MDAVGMFLEHYEMNVWYVDDLVLAGLTSDQLRSVPAAGQTRWRGYSGTRRDGKTSGPIRGSADNRR